MISFYTNCANHTGIRVHIDECDKFNESDDLHLSYIDNQHASSSSSTYTTNHTEIRVHIDTFDKFNKSDDLRLIYVDNQHASSSRSTLNSTSSTTIKTSTYNSRLQLQTLNTPHKKSSEKENDVLTQLMLFGLKGCIDPRVKDIKAYGGAWILSHNATRLKYAESLLNEIKSGTSIKGIISEKDVVDLKRIVQHRFVQFIYTQKIKAIHETDASVQLLIDEIIENISLLDGPQSEKVTISKDGATSFCLPGCYQEHFMRYKFKKHKGEYYFVIYDRSFRRNAVARWMQGSLRSRKVDDKTYDKTTLSIKTSKEALTDRKFIESLLRFTPYVPYAEIHLFLIRIYKGEIVRSEVESLLDRLYVYETMVPVIADFGLDTSKRNIQEVTAELFKRAKDFHRLQTLPTCTETNNLESDTLASRNVREALQLYTLQKAETQLKNRLLELEKEPDSFEACVIKTPDSIIRKKKSEYVKDAVLLQPFVRAKIDRLISKLNDSDRKTEEYNLKQAIQLARVLLRKLDTYSHPAFLILKKAAQARVKLQPSQEYIIEHNHDIEYYFGLLPTNLRQDFYFMLDVIKRHPEHNENIWKQDKLFAAWKNALDDSLKNNREFILEAIKTNPMALNAASDELKDDESFIEQAFTIEPWSIIYASERIINNTKYIDKYIKQLPPLPQIGDSYFKEDLEDAFYDQIPQNLKANKVFRDRYRSKSLVRHLIDLITT